jgi:hypothetical protein
MPRKRQPPYIKKQRQRGQIAIWLVDGAYVRTEHDIDFNNFGQHSDFAFIPANEFWIDHEKSPDEWSLFVDHMAAEHRALKRGLAPEDAAQKGVLEERAAREKAGDLKRLMPEGGLPDPDRVHITLWKKLENGVAVWMVDGRLVRSVFDLDFTMGGHDHVYEFVPPNEVWIDNDVNDLERAYVLIHELYERNRMLAGWDYTKAHTAASKIEMRYRKHPDELHPALAEEGWEA